MSDCEEHDFHQSAQDWPLCMREELIRLRAEVLRLHVALRGVLDQWDDYGGACEMKRIAKDALYNVDLEDVK